ncbi:N-acyl homoserine lactonase family protein [uncultured Jatrophihabitans sp.]|uniref:N-acyl homoserine lactonase family protein n=1 Tax=uncultured Jatrophihabitans sp. TaxID=1610747 RepID=UPI0035CA155A
MTLAFARRMWALDCPSLTVEAVTLMYGLSGMVTIPMPSFLIEHPKGLVLFDTGIAPAAIDDPVALYGQEMADALGITSTPDQRLDRQIAALGYKLTDVTHVISSHLHFDHSGGHHLFPQATFYCGQGEMRFAHFPDPLGDFCFMPDELAVMSKFTWREVPGVDVDLFGDGSMIILFMPGHTPGELSLKVRLSSRTFLLTGDAVHLRAALDQEFQFPLDCDTKSSLQTLRRLKRIAEVEDTTVWITHDPDDWAEYKHAPACYE